ncbi:caspase family protein [Streptomyces longwoodensis]|uniref:caspase family protein n=1 Tax=Streptomyces longwoodensis TaxID=68231 RepID=UPI0033BB6D59
MGRYKALLIGAGVYETRGVAALPFVPEDLTRLELALRGSGYYDVDVFVRERADKQISANFVNGQVTGFLRRASAGDTLLVVLSGHGVHARGRDYLVPEDIHEDVYPFESGCVPIDWREQLERSLAGRVVFVIDACREGIDQDSMGLAGVRQWGQVKTAATLRRKVARVYGCSPGELSLFVRPEDRLVAPVPGVVPGESFSLFSRAVADVVAARPDTQALDLAAFKHAVQDRLTLLHRAYNKRGLPQTVRVDTDIETGDFLFLPSRKATAVRPSSIRSAQEPGRMSLPDGATMGVAAPARTAEAANVSDAAMPDRTRPGAGGEPEASTPNGGRLKRTVPDALGSLSADSGPASRRTRGRTGLRSRPRDDRQAERDRLRKQLRRSNRKMDRLLRRGIYSVRWGRLSLLVVTALAVTAGTGYALWASRGPGDDHSGRRAAGASASPGTSSPRSGSQRTASAPPASTLALLTGKAVNTPAVMALQPCTAAGTARLVKAQLHSERNTFDVQDDPVLVFTVTSTSACRIDAHPGKVRLTLEPAADDSPLWDSGACAAGASSRWIAVSPGVPTTITYRWNRRRLTSCTESTRAPGGTYLATGTLPGLWSQSMRTSFVIEE